MLNLKQNQNQESTHLSPELLQIELTGRASRELETNDQDLFVEMQLLFGCMLRKNIVFSNTAPKGDFIEVTQNLHVGLQTLMNGEVCGIGSQHEDDEASDIALGTPRWLMIDHKNGQWTGEFGLAEKPSSMSSIAPKWISKLITIADRNNNIFNLKLTQ